MTDITKIYDKYPVIGKALNFINLTNPSNACPYHGIDHLYTVFHFAAELTEHTHTWNTN